MSDPLIYHFHWTLCRSLIKHFFRDSYFHSVFTPSILCPQWGPLDVANKIGHVVS